MTDLFRGSMAGKAIRLLSGHRFLRYPDEYDETIVQKFLHRDSSSDADEDASFPELNWSRSRTREPEKPISGDVIRWSGPTDPDVSLMLVNPRFRIDGL